jgi:DNA-binding sugar fermentation-stimulating protein
VKTLVKYKCYKAKCPICGNTGSLQLFLNKSNKVTYARVRHYHGKVKYTYCKLNKQQLETLKCQSTQLPSVLDQDQSFKPQHHKLGQANLSSNHQNKWAGSSARIEHHPPKVGVVGSNPTSPVTSNKPQSIV